MKLSIAFPPVALLGLGACATIPSSPPPPAGDEPVVRDTERASPRLAPPVPTPPQDYSPVGLYANAHGDFIARKDRYLPSFRGSFRLLPGVNLDSEPGEFDLYHTNVEGMAPIVLDPDTVLLIGGQFESRVYDTSAAFRAQDQSVYTVGANIGVGHFFSDDTYVEGVFSPGVYSDFDGTLTKHDWQFFGRLLGTQEYSEDLYLKAGLEVTEVFDDFSVYPLLGFSSLFHPNWRADVLLPREATLSYLWSSASTLTLGLNLDGEQYRVRGSAAFGKRQYDLQIQELILYLGGTHRFDDNLSAFAKFGALIAGDHKFQGPLGNGVQGQAEPSLMFEVGLGWDF